MEKIINILIVLSLVILPTFGQTGFPGKYDNSRIGVLIKKEGIVKGKRTKGNIEKDIYYKNLTPVRYAYNRALKDRYTPPKGRLIGSYIFVRIDILNSGLVNRAKLIETDFSDTTFIKEALDTVKNWKFDVIHEKNDTTIFRYVIKLTQ